MFESIYNIFRKMFTTNIEIVEVEPPKPKPKSQMVYCKVCLFGEFKEDANKKSDICDDCSEKKRLKKNAYQRKYYQENRERILEHVKRRRKTKRNKRTVKEKTG